MSLILNFRRIEVQPFDYIEIKSKSKIIIFNVNNNMVFFDIIIQNNDYSKKYYVILTKSSLFHMCEISIKSFWTIFILISITLFGIKSTCKPRILNLFTNFLLNFSLKYIFQIRIIIWYQIQIVHKSTLIGSCAIRGWPARADYHYLWKIIAVTIMSFILKSIYRI